MQDMMGFQVFKELRYVNSPFPFVVFNFMFKKKQKTQHCDLNTVHDSFRG